MAQPQDGKDEASLPAILCLHGYGTNAAIFRYQLRHITQALTVIFRFIFVEAPFHVQQPGPGFRQALPTPVPSADGTRTRPSPVPSECLLAI